MTRKAWLSLIRALARIAVILVLAQAIATPVRAAIEYDFIYVDAFQGDYALRESYVFDLNNHGVGCGFATDLPSYAGFYWSAPADKTRLPFTLARGVNEVGQVAGLNKVYDTASGTVVTIPLVPGAVASPVALAINDRGVVVGYAETCICSNSDRMLQIPFVWDPVGGSRSIAVAGAKELVKLNGANVAVGNIRGGSPDGFVHEIDTGRTIRLSAYFPTQPYPWTEAAAINDLGMVAGRHRSDDAQSFHGFVWTEAAGATLLPHLGGNPALSVQPWAINDAGLVVGMAEISSHVWRAFVWEAGRGIRDLNSVVTLPPNFILDRALAINDRGWIAGDGHYGPTWSSSQAFVLVPRVESTVGVMPQPPVRPALRAWPNPSPGTVTIEYVTGSEAQARIGIFDLEGRKVADLAATTGAARWDGRDASGRGVKAGVYLVRLEVPGAVIARAIALVR